MAYKAPKLDKSETLSAIFARISLIAKWLCDGYLKSWQLANWFWEISLLAKYFANSEFLCIRSAENAIFDVLPQFQTT
jgi:hypothetical protein